MIRPEIIATCLRRRGGYVIRSTSAMARTVPELRKRLCAWDIPKRKLPRAYKFQLFRLPTFRGCSQFATFQSYTIPANSALTSSEHSMASAKTGPSGPTFFESIKKSYADVPVHDNTIETSAFLEASESMTSLFGRSKHLFLFPF